MNQDYRTLRSQDSVRADNAVTHRVLRNTYWLLALSMLPTVLGAWLGIKIGFSLFSSPMLGILAFLGISFAFIFGIQHFRNSSIGVLLLLGFTFFMGLMLSRLLGVVLGFQNGASLIMLAFSGTAGIFMVMAVIATSSKRDFSFLSQWLITGFVLILLASVANIFLNIPALMLAISAAIILLFSAWLLFDIQRIIKGGETNYITATLSIYLSLYNIFTNLLALLSALGGNRQ